MCENEIKCIETNKCLYLGEGERKSYGIFCLISIAHITRGNLCPVTTKERLSSFLFLSVEEHADLASGFRSESVEQRKYTYFYDQYFFADKHIFAVKGYIGRTGCQAARPRSKMQLYFGLQK